jgi:hypothetical protein
MKKQDQDVKAKRALVVARRTLIATAFVTLVVSSTQAKESTLALRFGSTTDRFLLEDKGKPAVALILDIKSDYARLKQAQTISSSEILRLSVRLAALRMFHARKYKGTESEEMRGWIKGKLMRLPECAERETLLQLVVRESSPLDPKRFKEEVVNGSRLAALCAFTGWDMKCRTEADLASMSKLFSVVKAHGIHRRYMLAYEGSVQFATYRVRKDYKALRNALSLFKQGAKMDENPTAVKFTDSWCKGWEDYLKSIGK